MFRLSLMGHRRDVGVAILVLAATLPLGACKDKPANDDRDAQAAPTASGVTDASETALPSDAAPSAPADAEAPRRSRGGLRPGPTATLFNAAKALPLTPEQKTKLEGAEGAAVDAGRDETSRDATKRAAKELRVALTSAVKAGAVDLSKFEAKFAEIEKVGRTSAEKEADAIHSLHGILSTSERQTLVTDVRAKIAAREEKLARRRDHEDAGAKARPGRSAIERLARGLELDAEQQKKVEALGAKDPGPSPRELGEAAQKNLSVVIAAFEKDTFDTVAFETIAGKQARDFAFQEAKRVAQLVPLLKPAQRDKLAAKVDQASSFRDRRSGMGEHDEESGE